MNQFARPSRIPITVAQAVIAGYVLAIAAIEAIIVFGPLMVGLVADALLIPLLLNHYVLAEHSSYRRLLPALALIPLLRIVSLAAPLREWPALYWYVLVGAPMLLATGLTVRLLGLSTRRLGLAATSWPGQIVIALSGLPLSLAAFLVVRPQPLITEYNLAAMWGGILILTVFDGFLEELIFRGLLQGLAREVFGGVGALLLSTGLFTLMYLGNLSWGYLLFIGLVGLFFGWSVKRTGSIWGVALAHSLMKIGLLLVWPFLLG